MPSCRQWKTLDTNSNPALLHRFIQRIIIGIARNALRRVIKIFDARSSDTQRCTYLQALHVSICLDQADNGSITSKPAQQDAYHWWKGSESDGLRALDRRGTSTRPPSLESPRSSLERLDLSCQRRNW